MSNVEKIIRAIDNKDIILHINIKDEDILRDINVIADLIIFHAKIRANAEIMSQVWDM